MVQRNMIAIDEEKCNGCGLCVPACAEGAIRIVNGKARLISDEYCDGLGACIGECPQGALTVEKREAAEFDEKAVEKHLREVHSASPVHSVHQTPHSCPSTQVQHLGKEQKNEDALNVPKSTGSQLSHWPIQLMLVPSDAPFFKDADLVIAADCVPFAYINFHENFLKNRAVAVGCPKLDDAEFYVKKLAEIFNRSSIKSLLVVNMEVPCCFGLYRLVEEALKLSGKKIPLKQQIISVNGEKANPVSSTIQR